MLRYLVFREELRDIVRDRFAAGGCWTNHIRNAARYRVYVTAVGAGHLALLYVDLVGAMSNEGERTADEISSPQATHDEEP